MSEDTGVQAVNAAEEAHRYSGALGIGEPAAAAYQIERAHRYCIVLCRHPRDLDGQRVRCPDCYGRALSAWIEDGQVIPPPAPWAWRLGEFLGGWAAAWHDATVGMVRRPAAGGQ